ncbi:Putative F-box domain, WD40/YVTN repeat-like-containing domain superfamily [Septoria linicola]|uniref:F-box domain, WD40/YVTN repeat-like-containing domain superfamily n=1 Tax=Septoria linicola TaxID=215465 RepID=A0A9Q9AKF4_9PEZI|nr:putative F-box domain, WD40/YVTN repeat-like-containing domain superfamily [Septoria linicola]USW47571.1 Putative F-box domain, WD40/YVTN repeat-like-containing domain superfamily [Septoria linicola]
MALPLLTTTTTSAAPLDPFYTSTSRPRMPDGRPHTVHASSSSPFISGLHADCGEQEYDSSDSEDLTPRASAAEPNSFRGPDHHHHHHHHVHRRRMSRDDTHNDMHMLAGSLSAAGSADVLLYEDIPPHLTEQEFRLEQTRARRNRSPMHSEIDHADTSKHASSIGRRFSKYSKDRVNNLRESMHRYTLPVSVGRGRRSSTPVPIDCHETACINPALLSKQPTSPSKRTARHDNDRPRKYRTHLFPSGDRKDTPAPTTTLGGQGLPLRSATSSRFVPTIGAAPGGDAARRAAAMHNHSQFPTSTPEWLVAQQDLHDRRQRLGSLSSAADSGADLSTYSESDKGSVRDADGDVDMLAVPESTNRDFTRQFPEELSLLIFQQLDAQTLLRAEQVCQKWNTMAKDVSVWRTMFLRKYQRQVFTDPAPVQVGGNGIGLIGRANQEWRKMYKARVELQKNWRAGADKAGKAIYLSGHTDSVYCLQFDEEKIITGSRDRTIRVWDINTYQCLRVIGGPNVRPIAGPKVLRTVDYPSFHMATASVNGTAYGDNIYHQPQYYHDASILCLQYDDKILVTGSSDSDLIVWNIKTYQPITRLSKHTGGVLDVALDSKHIISCSKDSRIIVWDRETLAAKGELIGHKGPVNAVQLRGHLLVSASGDGIARLWDINQMKLLKEFPSKERGLAAVEFSEDMRHVLAGGNDNITYKFETSTGAEVMQYTGHSQLVRSLWLDSANDRVVSGSYDLDLRVYDFTTGEELWRGEEWTTSWMLAAKSDYRRIVATSQDGRILIVDFGILKGAPTYQSRDGMPIDNIDLLRGIEHTSEIKFRDPFERRDTVTRRS